VTLPELLLAFVRITADTVLQFVVVAIVLQIFLRGSGHRKIQARVPSRKTVLREAKLSLQSCLVFSLVGVGTVWLQRAGFSKVYDDAATYGWGWLIFSTYLMFAIHDVWHYALHRLCHDVPFLYKHVHKTHHSFSTPTPWSADAFHPLDALVNISFLPLFVLVLPVHALALKGYLILAVVLNTLGHSGYELMPKGLTRHPVLRFLNSTTAHDIHHQKVHCNYGLYTNILDRLLGTWHPSTAATYERVTEQEAEKVVLA
jgi:sterol desaturase/sphingolipid hydroxylase (fatty acid hydroxylase superfamily)